MALATANAVEAETRFDHEELMNTQRRLKVAAVANATPVLIQAAATAADVTVKALRKTQEDRRKTLGG